MAEKKVFDTGQHVDGVSRVLGYDRELENSVMGAVLFDPKAARPLIMQLTQDDFGTRPYWYFIEQIQAGIVDQFAVVNAAMDAYPEWRESTYHEFTEATRHLGGTFMFSNLPDQIDLILTNTNKRRVFQTLSEAISELANGGTAQQAVLKVLEGRDKLHSRAQGTKSMKDLASSHFDQVTEWHLPENRLKPGEVRGISSGYRNIDKLLRGIDALLYVIGARPSVGKTALALNMLYKMLRVEDQRDLHIVYCTAEMGPEQLLSRLMCAIAKVDINKVIEGNLSMEPGGEYERYVDALAWVSDRNIYFTNVRTIDQVVEVTYNRMPDILFVDYLHNLSGGPYTDNDVKSLGYYTGACYNIVKDLKIPVFLLAQLSRASEKRQDKKPVMSDLRGSGEIEQKADVILFEHRLDDNPRELTLIKRKGRAKGAQHSMVPMYFGKYGEIEDGYKGERE